MSIVCSRRFVSVSLHPRPLLVAIAAMTTAVMTGSTALADSALRQTYVERSLVSAADTRCQLFEPRISRALAAAVLQTRGALLRSGLDPIQADQLAQQARIRADGLSCADAELATVKGRVENAFSLWLRAARINFPATGDGWAVDRFSGSKPGWRIQQNAMVGASPVRFGLVGNSPDNVQPMAVVSFKGRSRPYGARIVMRDVNLMPRPSVVGVGVAEVPPAAARKAVFAARSDQAPRDLLAADSRQGEIWLFPNSVIAAMEQLDPREVFYVDFLFRDDTVARVRMEAGDLKAARTFLSLGPV